MAGECTYDTHCATDDTFGTTKTTADHLREVSGQLNGVHPNKSCATSDSSPFFEMIGESLYRKKLERGFVHYREVLFEDKRLQAIATFHVNRHGMVHHTLEDTYRLVAEQYWWEGMYFQVRDFVQGCEECKQRRTERTEHTEERRVSRTVVSHSQEVLNKMNGHRAAGLFCDITLKTGGGRSFFAHKAVLAAVSEYFQELFTEMDWVSNPQSQIDLTGFSEESLLALLEFSYTSTLTLTLDNLTEVSTMARHLRMWPALEACTAIQRERDSAHTCPKTRLSEQDLPLELPTDPSLNSWRNEGKEGLKRKRDSSLGEQEEEHGESSGSGKMEYFSADFHLDDSNGEGSNNMSHILSQSHTLSENGFPCSPTRRMKLMDFKSPSSKRKPSPRSTPTVIPSSPSTSTRSSSPSRRLLRSSPGAALALRRLLPKIDLSKNKKKSFSSRTCRIKPDVVCSRPQSTFVTSVTPVTPVKVKEEVDEQEVSSVIPQEEVHSPRTQEKYRLLSFLGLQRKSLLPGPEELSGWGQKKRLRKLKVSNYSLTTRRKPRSQGLKEGYGVGLGALVSVNPTLSLCDMTRMDLLKRAMKVEPQDQHRVEQMKVRRRRRDVPVEPSMRSTRSRDASLSLSESHPTQTGRPLRSSLRDRQAAQSKSGVPSQGTHLPKKAALKIKKDPADFTARQPTRWARSTQCHQGAAKLSASTASRSTAWGCLPVKQTVRITSTGSGRHNSTRTKHNYVTTAGKVGRRAGRRGEQQTRKKKEEKVKDKGNRQEEKAEACPNTSFQDPISTNYQHLHNHPLYRAIKEEPADPMPVSHSFTAYDASDLGKRQSKPPVKMLDPGFLFGFCPAANGIKREEDSVDICLTQSLSQENSDSHDNRSTHMLRRNRISARIRPDRTGLNGPHWAGLGARSTVHSMGRPIRVKREKEEVSLRPVRVKRERQEISVSQRAKTTRPHSRPQASKRSNKVKKEPPTRKAVSNMHLLHGQRSALLESIRRARLRQLKGPRNKSPVSAHTCLQCHMVYRDCDALLTHRMRHIEGKHWPCPLCSKTFFRQKKRQESYSDTRS